MLLEHLAELPADEWVLEAQLVPLELESARPHRLKVFTVHGREVFALLRGAGELLIGFVPSVGGPWSAVSRIELHDFDAAWDEVIQLLPLRQAFSDTVILAVLARNVRDDRVDKLYRAVVDVAGGELRVIPGLEAQQPAKDSRIWSRRLPSELEPLARFPIEAHREDDLALPRIRHGLSRLDMLFGEQGVCAVIQRGRWLLATNFDRLHDISMSKSESRLSARQSHNLPGRAYSIDVRSATSDLEVLLTTEDARLLACALEPATWRSAACPRNSLISTTDAGRLLLAHHDGLDVVEFVDVLEHRATLLDAIDRALDGDWLRFLTVSDHELPKRVATWLAFRHRRGFVDDEQLASARRRIEQAAKGELAAALGREITEQMLDWGSDEPLAWRLVWDIYQTAAIPFRREIDAGMRPGEFGPDHARLLERAARSSFALMFDSNADTAERIDAVLEVALAHYLLDATRWITPEGEIRSLTVDGTTMLVLRPRTAATMGSLEGSVDTIASLHHSPTRFARGSVIGREDRLLQPAFERWPEHPHARGVDGLRSADGRTFVLLRDRVRGYLAVLPSAGESQLLSPALDVPAPSSFDLHPDQHTIAVVGGRTATLHWLSLEGDARGQAGLPDLPCCVRFNLGGACILVGTTRGLVLAFEWSRKGCGALLWVFCGRGRAQRLEVGPAGVLLVVPGEELTVLSHTGQRLWRFRQRRIQAAAWLPNGEIVIAMRDGQLVRVRPGRPEQIDEAGALLDHRPRGYRVMLARDEGGPELLDHLDGDDRLVLIERLTKQDLAGLPISKLSARDLAAVARSVEPKLDAWERVFEAATTYQARGLRGVAGLAAQTTAIAECLRRIPELQQKRGFGIRQLARVPPRVWQSSLHLWIEVIAADLLLRDALDWRQVVEDAARLPFAVLHAAAGLDPARAGPASLLAWAAEIAAQAPDRLDVALTRLAEALAIQGDDVAEISSVMATIACKTPDEVAWREVRDCLGYARLVAAELGQPLVTLVHAANDGLTKAPPEPWTPLSGQQAWLQTMLGHGFRLASENLPDDWAPLLSAWMDRLRVRFHAVAQRELMRVVSTTRVQPQIELDGSGRLQLTLTPEGSVDLEHVTLELRLDVGQLEPIELSRPLVVLRPNDPPLQELLDVSLGPTRQIELTIRIRLGEVVHDETTWTFSLRLLDDLSAMLSAMPDVRRRLLDRIQAHSSGEAMGDLIVVGRPADLDELAKGLEQRGANIIPDIVGGDWRARPGIGVLYPASRRALACLADAAAPSLRPHARVWLVEPALGTRLTRHLGGALLHTCRAGYTRDQPATIDGSGDPAGADVDDELFRQDLTKLLVARKVLYEDARPLLARTEGDLRVCQAYLRGESVEDAMIEALRDDLGGVGPLAIAALLSARSPAQRSEFHVELAKVEPLASHRSTFDRLGLLDPTGHTRAFIVAVERMVGGPEQLWRRLTNQYGLLDELPIERHAELGPTTLRRLVPDLDDRKIGALLALSRLWRGEGGQAAMQQFVQALAHDGSLRVSKASHASKAGYSERIGEWTIAFVSTKELDRRSSDEGELASLVASLVAPCIVLGPGIGRIEPSPGIHRLEFVHMRRFLASENWWHSCLATVRSLGGATPNPFRSHGALEPGSPLFVGRERIRGDFERTIDKRHILLLGPRRIGKTSLMNQLYHDAYKLDHLEPLWAEAQGIHLGEQLPALRHGATHQLVHDRHPGEPWLEHLRRCVAAIRREGRVPVLFVNEIDGLASFDPSFLGQLRGELEQGLRLVAVGYSRLIRGVHQPDSFFYHLTSDGRVSPYTRVGVLDEAEGRALVDQIKKPHLGFWWVSDEAERQGRDELVQHSLGIPWRLQDACSRLVDRLNEQRRGVLYLDDVRFVIAHAPPLLASFQLLDFSTMQVAWPSDLSNDRVQLLVLLVLHIMARKLYFRVSSGISFNALPEVSTERFRFRASDVERSVHDDLDELPCVPEERRRIAGWVAGIAMPELMVGLTLTMVLESSIVDGDEFFAFFAHLFPIELWRAYARGGRTIDDRILELTTRLVTP